MAKLQTLVIGVLMSMMFMVGLGMILGDVASKEGLTYDNESEAYNRINASYAEFLDIQSQVNSTTDTASGLDVVGGLLDRGIAAVKLTFVSTGTAIALTSEGANEIGIPYIVQLVFASVIIIFILIIIIKLFTRTDV